MNETSLKKFFKNININELYFDIFIAVSAVILRIIAEKTNFLSNESSSFVLITTFFSSLIFFYFGKKIYSFIKHKSNWKWLFILLGLLTGVMIFFALMTTWEAYNIDFEVKELNGVALLVFLMALLFGLISGGKFFVKATKITGIITVIIIAAGGFIYLLQERLLDDLFSILVLVGILILSVIFIIILPVLIIKRIEKNEKSKKIFINTLAVLSALSFAMWSLLVNEYNGSMRDLFSTYIAAMFLFRIMLALEPPKNKTNMIIGVITVLFMFFFTQ